MAKIKTERLMSVGELFEWGFKKELTHTYFESEQGGYVGFDMYGNFECEFIGKDDTFIVKTDEKEIYRNTIFPRLVSVRNLGEGELVVTHWEDTSVEMMDGLDTIKIYMLDDYGNMILIWQYGDFVNQEDK